MGSRIRENPSHIFECFCEVVIPSTCDEKPWILVKFPDNYNKQELLKSIPGFAYPCDFVNHAVQHFSFVLTSIDSKWTFGFCRHAPNSPTCFVILSYLPWHETFYKVLNEIADLTNKKSNNLESFLESLYKNEVPKPGMQLHVLYNNGLSEFGAQCPDHHKLPSIPENRNLMEYYNAINISNMLVIFASMLQERRIIITSKKLSKLSACAQAANLLIYPMFWQHIFIPVLPLHLVDYLSAPMPFLIGVPASIMARVKLTEIGDVVLLDADNDKIGTPFGDLESMPSDLVYNLKRNLKTATSMLGDTVARVFLRAVVQLIGGYREALTMKACEKITFSEEDFIKSRPTSMQPFLEKMLQLQIFQQFIEGRLQMLNSGQVCADEFEAEVNLYEDKSSSRFKVQYREWVSTMKKEGGALLKTVKNKANPAVKHAYRSVKHRGKKAYKEIRSKIQHQKYSQDDLSLKSTESRKPRSAPASPTSFRRPITMHDVELLHKNLTRKKSVDNSPEILRTRQYNLLEVDEVADEAVYMSETDDSSPSLSMNHLDLNLMQDLQEMLVTKCTFSSSETMARGSAPPIDRTLKPQKSLDTQPTIPKVLPFLQAPVPPPRSRRRMFEEAEVDDKLLIRLDSNEDIEETFDPLLSAKPLAACNPPSRVTSTFQSNPLYFAPTPSAANSARFQTNPFLVSSNPPTTVPSSWAQFKTGNSNGFAGARSDQDLLQDYGLNFSNFAQSSSQRTVLSTSPSRDPVLDPFADLVNWPAASKSANSFQKPNL